MSNQSQTSPFQEDLAHEEEEQEDKKLQELSQELPGGGGGEEEERKLATLLPSAQKTSIARNPFMNPHDAAMSSATQKQISHALKARLGLLISSDDEEGVISPEEEEEEPKTSIASNPVLNPRAASMSSEPLKQVADAVKASLGLLSSDDEVTSPEEEEPISRRVIDLNPKSLPFRTPAKRLLENSATARNGASQGKEKKIKDKAHDEDGGADENPTDDSASM